MEIKLNPTDFDTAIKGLDAVKASLETCKEELKASYTTMKESWLGNGGNAFEVYYTNLFTKFEENIIKLGILSADISTALKTMQTQDERISIIMSSITGTKESSQTTGENATIEINPIIGRPPSFQEGAFQAKFSDVMNNAVKDENMASAEGESIQTSDEYVNIKINPIIGVPPSSHEGTFQAKFSDVMNNAIKDENAASAAAPQGM